jgi:hypothetical protein
MVKAEQRRYAWLDGIAQQRQISRIRELEQQISQAEKSAVAFPINPMVQGQGYIQMQSQIAQRVGELREQRNTILSLSGDDLVMFVCADEIANAEQPEWVELTNPDGSLLRRGNYYSPLAPGMC